MIKASWSFLSLRASLTAVLLMTALPLLVSALLSYHLFRNHVIADYQDVLERLRNQSVPTQNLQLAMLQIEIPLEEYLLTAAPGKLRDFRYLRQEIESTFAQVINRFDNEEALSLLKGARGDWNAINAEVTEMMAANETANRDALSASLSRFDSLQATAHDKLESAYALIEEKIEADYRDATIWFERSVWIAGISAGLSILVMVVGIYIFGRIILRSADMLVEGAERFAEGDRDHRIEIQVPPELGKVAEEFNRMIVIIRNSEEKLADLARRDKLTGLLNRVSYEEVIKEAFERFGRYDETFALVALDIDHFKRVNDTYGHDVGDQVLRAVADVMRDSVRNIDKVFRTGGEEFLILLPRADRVAARVTAERIRSKLVGEEIIAGKHVLKVTASLGFALPSSGSDTPEVLHKHADVALYEAKRSGRNRVIEFNDPKGEFSA